METKLGKPSLKQWSFVWSTRDKHIVLRNFQMELNNIFIAYGMYNAENVTTVKNWLSREGLHFILTLRNDQQDTCGTFLYYLVTSLKN